MRPGVAACRDKAQADGRQCLGSCGVAQELIETLILCVASGGSPPVCIARVGIAVLRVADCAERCLDGLSSSYERCLEANKQCIAACPEK